MAEKETPSPSGNSKGTGADASETPRPIARRPHPVIKPATETISLQQIGGGALQTPAAAPGGSPPVTPPSQPSQPSSPSSGPAALNAPQSPSTLGSIGPLSAPSGADAAPPASTAPGLGTGISAGLSAVGQAGSGSASGGMTAPPSTPPSMPPPASVVRPDITRPTFQSAAAEEPGFDSRKAVGIGIGVVVVLLAFFILKAALPSKIPVPDKFSTYNSASGAFSLDAPVGWARKGEDTKREDSATGQQYTADADGATITYGKAIIQVWTDSGGDAMQNQLLSGGGPNFAALLDDKHKEFQGILKKRVSGYNETDAGSFSLAPFGAKVVEYTGTSGFLFFGGKVHGYAATVQGPKHFMQILLQCPENNWDDLKPVYERILKSAALDGVSAKTLQERLGGFGGGAGGAGGAGGLQIPGGGSVRIPPGVGGF